MQSESRARMGNVLARMMANKNAAEIRRRLTQEGVCSVLILIFAPVKGWPIVAAVVAGCLSVSAVARRAGTP